MVYGTILDSKPVRTSFGMEYRVMYDSNPEAKAQSGCAGPGISGEQFKPGDRVQLAYETGTSFGLWFIIGKVY
jgi:hypothetical protein